MPLKFSHGFLSLVLSFSFLSACNTNVAEDDQNVQAPVNPMMEDQKIDKNSESEPDNMGQNSTLSEAKSKYESGVLQPFDSLKFEAAQADGRSILLDFYAAWCHVCRSNAPIIESGLRGTKVVAFRVDYDQSHELKKTYGVTLQSTYILLRDGVQRKMTGALTSSTFVEFISS